jgi:hypothetical protein
MQITSRCKSFGNKIYGVSRDFSSGIGKIMFKRRLAQMDWKQQQKTN